ncbi:MAG: polysaccharide ABC transporter ATP-binding protein [Hylemonella sp.]|nr:polysaccharide ABC transporter ATP-binding protein [Hylemonella sp.]
MRSEQLAITCSGVAKTYRLFGHPGDRIRQALSLGRLHLHREFTALQDISFDIHKGETVGIIGRNGSGKSTLLQLVCGILRPTAGRLDVTGRISALLELGAGFNPEFTGRENIYFQGAVMGFTRREMDVRLGDIIGFAGIGDFIDQPVRTYSSGMFVRLAFSVSVHVDPEILVVDEALGVGDAEFQARSISRMKALQGHGVTILLVSHSIPVVRNFCERVIWLDRGKLRLAGESSMVCQAYLDEVDQASLTSGTRAQSTASTRRFHPSGQEKTISIKAVTLSSPAIEVGEDLTLSIELDYGPEFPQGLVFGVGVIVHGAAGRIVALFNTLRDDLSLTGAMRQLRLRLPGTAFIPGQYSISVNVCDSAALFPFDAQDHCLRFEVRSALSRLGLPRWEGEVACAHAWEW